MIELKVQAAGVRDSNEIHTLDYQFGAVWDCDKVDGNRDIACSELDERIVNLRQNASIFSKPGLEPHFVGAMVPALWPSFRTQPPGA